MINSKPLTLILKLIPRILFIEILKILKPMSSITNSFFITKNSIIKGIVMEDVIFMIGGDVGLII